MKKKARMNPFDGIPERKDITREDVQAPGAAPGDTPGYKLHISRKQ